MSDSTVQDAPEADRATVQPKDRVPFGSIFAWAIGSVGANYAIMSINALALPIYNIALGVDPVKLGWAMSLPRVVDAFFDPWLGWVSDNTRSRWGRRKPYIVAGAFPLALLTVLLWIPPARLGPSGLFWYFLAISIVYYLAYSLCAVPQGALGYELSADYHERTRIMGWSSIFGLLGGLGMPWLYKLTLLPSFGGNEVLGVRWVGGMLAIVIFCTSIAPGIFCRERYAHSAGPPIGLIESMVQTLRNRPFRILVMATSLMVVITSMVGPCLYYVNIFEICGGKRHAAQVIAWSGTVQTLAAFAGVPFNTWLSRRLGKRVAGLICIAVTTIGYGLYAVTLTPRYPYLQLISAFVVGWGIQGIWIMCGSMTADVCDHDELNTGHRREAFYGAALGISIKAGLAIAAILSGYLVHIAGYRDLNVIDPAVMVRMRHIFVWSQVIGLSVCWAIFFFYPLSRERLAVIRAELDARRQAAAPA
jgi:glycoside/pentoside/hexuronide:cation symporter, GPH family